MPRVNIYVPPEMKQLMDKLEGRLNWSGIAQNAFSRAISAETTRQECEDALACEVQRNLSEWMLAFSQTEQ